MTPSFYKNVVRIDGPDELPVGSGCLLVDRKIITCAHVVADALGNRNLAYAEEKPEALLKVCFPFSLRRKELFDAEIIHWRPICHENERDLPDDGLSDMAMLLLAADTPVDVRPADLIDDLDLPGQDFEAHGFPKIGLADWRGCPTEGRIGGRRPPTWFSLEPRSVYGQKVREGFSGAPVWVRGQGAVAGIIAEFICNPEMNEFGGVMIGVRALKQFDDAITATLRLGQEALGEVFGAPGYPTRYVERTALLERLRNRILDREGTVAVSGEHSLGLHGMGGIGKTVLAVALVRDREVRRTFSDGIFWITVGQSIDAASLQAQLYSRITRRSLTATTIEAGKEALREALEHRHVLIVLDDVWQPRLAEVFPSAGDGWTLLITTRIREVIEEFSAIEEQIHVVEDREALNLLEQYAGDAFPRKPNQQDVLDGILNETGKLPLALALVGTMARRAGASFWPDILQRLKDARLDRIAASIPNYRTYENLLKSLEASVLTLSEAERVRYAELGVFAEDTPVPMSVLEVLWSAESIDRLEVWELANTFVARALASWTTDGHLALHDLQRDYIRATVADLRALHVRLVDAYSLKCPDGWASGPDDGYFFQFLPQHLAAAGRHDELMALLADYAWIEAKLKATDVQSLIADYNLVANEPDLSLVQGALRLSIAALSRDPVHLPSQLIGRLRNIREPRVQALIKRALFGPGSPWLQPLTTSLRSPTTSLLQTLAGHMDHVTSAMLTPDCRIAVSGAWDGTVRIWDLQTAAAKHILKLAWISAVAITRDGSTVITGDNSGRVKVFDVERETIKYDFPAHGTHVNAVAISDDGSIGVSCSREIIVWDVRNGSSRYVLNGHESTVNTLAITADGRLALSSLENNTVRVWDLEVGCLKFVFSGHNDAIQAITVTPDGGLAISGSKDGAIRVWDVTKRMLLHALDGHETPVKAVAISKAGNNFFLLLKTAS